MFRRAFAALVVLAVAGLLFVLLWPQFFGLQRTFGVAQLVSLRAVCIVVAVVAAVLSTVLALLIRAGRRFLASLAVMLLVFGALNTAVLATRGFGSAGFQTATESDVTVLSWNTLGDAPGVDAIADLVLRTSPDIVTLPETTKATADEVARRAQAAGNPLIAYTIAFDQVSKARSTSLLISQNLGSYVISDNSSNTAVLPSVVAVPTSGGPLIVAVHAVAPTSGNFADWRSDLAWIASQCGGADAIIAGDFNSTLDHFTGFDADVVADDGTVLASDTVLGHCRDAAAQSGNAAVGSWPTSIPPLLGTPIDHVLMTPDWRVTGFRVIQDQDGAGSDHRPILAQLTPG
ncbi:endonuclease/exonuclease/phosphatase family protein [Naasia lichenicola]|uniref:Endonuclease/exonuclease/phosphatase family protein n=1 Tax=Naasia lichenicola TaxID=2565933 RepID=A0A4S4FEC5_9MICO|nr:endonuclease/exonuclease/phosphatase family protein [Naasia lichenicola]THG28490.1 endonuclease/exonuclease/phosphatase family protein [Naasia lichenicola]